MASERFLEKQKWLTKQIHLKQLSRKLIKIDKIIFVKDEQWV